MHIDLRVNWVKGYDGWLQIDTLNLQDEALNDAFGVYVIWNNKTTVKVGSGRLREEFAKLKTDRNINSNKDLVITWCIVHQKYVEGIRNYLTRSLKPVIKEGYNDMPSISVNKPGELNYFNIGN